MKILSMFSINFLIFGSAELLGQGTIAFSGQVSVYGTNYYEQGMWFHDVIPTFGTGSPNYDSMGIIQPHTVNNLVANSTTYLDFFQESSPNNFVSFSLTNGHSFGLTSVQLADPSSPSASQIPILFVGFLGSGSSVTNIFTTPGGGATTFQSYVFSSAFASGLTSVDILAPRWAMDNLVFGNMAPVPEPGTADLITAGLLSLAARKLRCR